MSVNLFEDASQRKSAEPYERLARKALASYGLQEARLDLVSKRDCVTFRVVDDVGESAAAYALRVYPSGSDRDRILRVLSWLSALRQQSRLPVPEPVLTRSGEWIQSRSTPGLSGFHPITLSTWVHGSRPAEWTTDHAFAAGSRIAALHKHAETYVPSATCGALEDGADSALQRITSALPSRLDAGRLLETAADQVRSSIQELGAEPQVFGLIHGNPTREHILFQEGDARVIGFGHCQLGHYLYDLASLLLDVNRGEEGDKLRRHAIDGYRAVRPSSADIERHVDAFAILRLLDQLREATAPRKDGEALTDRAARRIADQLRVIAEARDKTEANLEKRAPAG